MDRQRMRDRSRKTIRNMSFACYHPTQKDIEMVLGNTKTFTVPVMDLVEHNHRDLFRGELAIMREDWILSDETDTGVKKCSRDNKFVGFISKDYTMAQHADVFNNITEMLSDNGIKYSVPVIRCDQRTGKNQFNATIRMDDIKMNVDGSDISPTIDVFNSTDGKSSATFMFGAFRSKCANGMYWGEMFGEERYVHRRDVSSINFGERIEQIAAGVKELGEQIEKMQGNKLIEETLKALEKAKFNPTFIKNYQNIVEIYMLKYDEEIPVNTLWGLYASATNWLSNYMMLKSYQNTLRHHKILNTVVQHALSGKL